ncbi:MAG: hypothetical protein WD042_11825 [Phycisphaeraceae bacterium]
MTATRQSCRLAAVAIAAILSLGVTAQRACALPVIERYVQVTATPETLDLGTAPGQGDFDSPSELTVKVAANCATGGVVASVSALQMTGGGSIGPERVFVKLPLTGNYVAMTNPVVVTPPTNPGTFNIVLKFRVQTTIADAPGQYVGTVTITVAPPT